MSGRFRAWVCATGLALGGVLVLPPTGWPQWPWERPDIGALGPRTAIWNVRWPDLAETAAWLRLPPRDHWRARAPVGRANVTSPNAIVYMRTAPGPIEPIVPYVDVVEWLLEILVVLPVASFVGYWIRIADARISARPAPADPTTRARR